MRSAGVHQSHKSDLCPRHAWADTGHRCLLKGRPRQEQLLW